MRVSGNTGCWVLCRAFLVWARRNWQRGKNSYRALSKSIYKPAARLRDFKISLDIWSIFFLLQCKDGLKMGLTGSSVNGLVFLEALNSLCQVTIPLLFFPTLLPPLLSWLSCFLTQGLRSRGRMLLYSQMPFRPRWGVWWGGFTVAEKKSSKKETN